MPPSRWERIEELFADCVGRAPAERVELLDRYCAGDADLRREIGSLLAAHETPEGILDAPPRLPTGAPVISGLLAPGTRLGPWRVGPLIGRGGAGEVYGAHRADGSFEQQVAIKVLQPEAAAQLDRFHAERRILARLEHPGIARLLDGGVTEDGRPYAVIEYVEGRPLVDHCREHGCDLEERLRLFGQVCEAAAHAHRNLVVHRDLKPGNILVDAAGRVKLLDFGIAKLLDAGDGGAAADVTRAPLTPDYAAPEQLTGEPVTTATDVYALGVLLFELLTGKKPFDASRLPGTEPPRGSLRGDLEAVVMTAMEVDPARRYATADKLADDVRRYLGGHPVALGRIFRLLCAPGVNAANA